jgi:acetyl esterase
MPAIVKMLKENSGSTQMKLQLDEETARRISPQHNVAENAPPAMIFFGTEDTLLGQLEPFVNEMKSKGNKVEVYMAPKQRHGFFNQSPWRERTIKRMDEFLAGLGYLEGPPTIEVPEGKN